LGKKNERSIQRDKNIAKQLEKVKKESSAFLVKASQEGRLLTCGNSNFFFKNQRTEKSIK